ncbi:sigma-70 family RNA polymerase sigma factor [Patescibacteria group bacterium]|nr:sigma-70 family RNA polymerase sigma factor [Patescibacteria group bacterium]
MQNKREFFERLKNDPANIAELYDRSADKLFRFLLKRVGHKETAEDMVSRTFVKLLEALPSLVWKGVSIEAWLYKTATNGLIDHWRSAGHKREVLADEFPDVESEDDPAFIAEINIEAEKLEPILSELSPRDQQVLDLKFFGGFELAEIAAVMDIQVNHASVLVYRALRRLRKKYLANV